MSIKIIQQFCIINVNKKQTMVKVLIKKLHEGASLPTRGSELAGGWDVTATEIVLKGTQAIYKLGFAMEIPKGYKISIVPRSSLTKTNWVLQNSPGTVDADYRGEVQVRFRYLGDENNKTNFLQPPFLIGERIAQIYLEEVIETEFELVDELDQTKRGSGGFGSTGR